MTITSLKRAFKNSFSYEPTISGIVVLINALLIGALLIGQQQLAYSVTPTEILLISTALICFLLTPLINHNLLNPLRLENARLQAFLDDNGEENQQLFEALDHYTPISLADLSGRIIYANALFCEMSGYSAQELTHQEYNIINLEYQKPKFMFDVWRTLKHGQAWKGKVRDTTKHGREYWADTTIIKMQGADKPKQYIAIRRDATLAKRNEVKQSVLLHLLDANTDMLMITDADGYIIAINKALAHFTGWQQEQLRDQLPEIMRAAHTDEHYLTEMQNSLQQGEAWNGRLLNQRPSQSSVSNPAVDSAEYWVDITITPLFNTKLEFIGCLQVQHDITAIVLKEQSLLLEHADKAIYLEIVTILQQILPLKRRFTQVLECLMRLKGLGRQVNGMIKGGIYIKEPNQDYLQLWVLQGEFSDGFMDDEQLVVMGEGLFGDTVKSQKLKLSNECFCDLHHEAVSDDMKTHGHYLAPIVSEGNTLGLLFLYTYPYPVEAQSRLDLLQKVSDLLAEALIKEPQHPLA